MAKEIKYRVWNKYKKQMLYPKDLELWDFKPSTNFSGIHCVRRDTRVCLYQEQGDVFMLYSGFTDKNGKEIWEGDIIIDKWKRKKGEEEIRIVESGTAPAYGLNLNEELWGGDWDWHDAHRIEVIGNIYENKKLIP